MPGDRRTFAQLIADDRATHEVEDWRGTLLDYLGRVRDPPTLPKLAHARVYDLLMGPVGSGKSALVEKIQRGLETSDPYLRGRGFVRERRTALADPAPFEA